MPRLLHLDASADPANSVSRAVTRTFADTWCGLVPGYEVTYRDLQADPPPHLPDAALHWAPRLREPGSAPEPAALALQQTLLDELLAADVLLIGAPMYNWSLPSTLKAWLDYIHVMGVTAPFDTREQPLAGRPAVVVSSRGGDYSDGSPTAGWDHTIPPLELVLGQSLGMKVSSITVDLTLAPKVEAMAALVGKGRASAEAAHAAAAQAARSLGG
ncbi:MAG TPA: NAD(P)H-dependent oxidoreductase [Mycobacteriales bacterium]|nr:NAD(P)H-dependent oxidoreductase [Mycobacteriales bacterium]